MFDGWDDLDRALLERDHARALALAVEAWAGSRSAALGNLVDALAVRVDPAPLVLLPTELEPFQNEWIAWAARADTVALDAVLATLLAEPAFLASTHDPNPFGFWRARVAALEARAPDPRIGPRLARLLVDPPPWGAGDRGSDGFFSRPIFQALRALADPRAAAILRQLEANTGAHPYRAYHAVIARERAAIEAAFAEIPPLDDDRLARIRAHTARLVEEQTERRRVPDALLARVPIEPDDEGTRQVLADALTELGDPRGELITLQFKQEQGRLSVPGRARMAVLLRIYEETWIGSDLRHTLLDRTYRRGFLDGGRLAPVTAVGERAWSGARGDPRIGTLRVVRLDRFAGNLEADFVASAGLVGLRTIVVESDRILRELVRVTLRGVTEVGLDGDPAPETMTTLDRLEDSLPALRRLTFLRIPRGGIADLLERVAASRLASRLPELAFEIPGVKIVMRWPDRGERADVEIETEDGAGIELLPPVPKIARLVIRPINPKRKLARPIRFQDQLERLGAAEIDLPRAWSNQIASARGGC